MNMKKNSLGIRLARYRKRLGLTQKELADRAELSLSSIAYYESAETLDFITKIEKMSNALGIPPSKLFATNTEKLPEASDFETMNPKTAKRLQQLLQLSPQNRTKIYEQIDFLLQKENKG
jgi:transcriptional regulator with XRE-family HTH domain